MDSADASGSEGIASIVFFAGRCCMLVGNISQISRFLVVVVSFDALCIMFSCKSFKITTNW